MIKPEENQKRIADMALDYGNRALEADHSNAKAHLNLAISYGHMTDFVGNKTIARVLPRSFTTETA